jgi:ABC-type dipeptide/oligopeptide/nickel transport system permease component
VNKVVLFRVLQFPLILAVIYLVTFLLAWVAPGDPFQNERNLDPIVSRTLRRQFHAESATSFLRYHAWNVIRHGDFGPSMKYQEWSVNRIISAGLPVSMTLGLFAMCIAVPVGVGIGTLAAVRRGGPADWASLSIALIGISIPSFVIASILLMFAAWTKWLPVGGWGTIGHLLLPGLALSLFPMAYIVRLMRTSMLDTLGADFVRTARAKGLSRGTVIWKHCLRNAFLPVLSYLGPATAGTMVGSFVVESVFNINGLGRYFVTSVANRDRTLILGVVMVESTLILFFNLLVDIAYAWVDPRIDIAAKAA